MTDRPILFSGPMVRAILEGRKTQTRRVIKGGPEGSCWHMDRVGATGWRWVADGGVPSMPWTPPYAPGDRLWVREAWQSSAEYDDLKPSDLGGEESILYRSDNTLQTWGWPADDWRDGRPRPGMFMPRWASRLTLIVTDVRVQRLRQISENDACAEGIERMKSGRGYYDPTVSKGMVHLENWHRTATAAFAALWHSLNTKRGYGWDANPWVCAVTFTAHHQNIDTI